MRPLYVCHAPFTEWVLAASVYRKGDWKFRSPWLPVFIAKVIGSFDHRVASMPRLAFEGLELSDGKLSRSVLRGLGGSNAPRLPGLP